MNPRLTDIPLHADSVRESGLPVDYYHAPSSINTFYFVLGVCVGMGLATLLIVTLFGTRL